MVRQRAWDWIRTRLARSPDSPSRALLGLSLALLGLSALAWTWPQLFLPRRLLTSDGVVLAGEWQTHLHCYKLDLGSAPYVDLPRADHPDRSPLLVTEEGRLLRRCTTEAELLAQPGGSLHAHPWLYLATSDGADPARSGRTYRVLVSPELLARESVWCAPRWVFWLNVAGHSLLALVWATCWSGSRASRYRWSVLFALAVFSLQHLHGQWDVFRIAHDSPSYATRGSFRPPGYPTFISLVAGGQHGLTAGPGKYPFDDEVRGAAGEPLLRVVRAQKLVLHAALLLLSALLMSALPPPGVVVCHLILLHRGWLSTEADWLLSEPLAQAWMLLLVGALVRLARGSGRWLVVLALLAGGLLATRLAGLYGVVFPLAGALLVLRREGRAGAPQVAIASALLAASVLLPAALRARAPDGGVSHWSTTRICFALQLARPGDEELMPDARAREFLRKALALLPIEQAKVRAGRTHLEQWEYLGCNLYQVAFPVVREMNLTPSETEAVFLRVAWSLYATHPAGLLGVWVEAFATATTRTTRLCSGPVELLGLFLTLVALAALSAPWARWVAATAVGAHVAHLVVVCTCDMPIARYVQATEPLVLLAGCVLALDAARLRLPALWQRATHGLATPEAEPPLPAAQPPDVPPPAVPGAGGHAGGQVVQGA